MPTRDPLLPPLPDARTTPARRRVPALIALGALAAWLAVCWRFALADLRDEPPPAALARWGDLFWLGRWRMFTDLRPEHTDLEAEALVGTAWAPVDLAALYPSRWDEGPGYLRDDFLAHPRRPSALADDACGRLPGAARIRLTVVRWPKTPGRIEQPRDGATRTPMLDHACASRRAGR